MRDLHSLTVRVPHAPLFECRGRRLWMLAYLHKQCAWINWACSGACWTRTDSFATRLTTTACVRTPERRAVSCIADALSHHVDAMVQPDEPLPPPTEEEERLYNQKGAPVPGVPATLFWRMLYAFYPNYNAELASTTA